MNILLKEFDQTLCDTNGNIDNITITYKEYVTDNLLKAKAIIAKIYPLHYRLEVLENVFSLLFIKNEDFVESSDRDSELSGEDWAEDVKSSVKSSDLISSVSTERLVSVEVAQEAIPDIETKMDEMESKVKKVTVQEELSEKEHLESSGIDKKKESAVSNHSNSSSRSLVGDGLLKNPFILRDCLNVLQDSLNELKADSSLAEDKQMNLEECGIEHSITVSDFHQRLSQLDQYVSEARWRFQLVTPDIIPQEFGKIVIIPKTKKEWQEHTGVVYLMSKVNMYRFRGQNVKKNHRGIHSFVHQQY